MRFGTHRMMKTKLAILPSWLFFAALSLVLAPVVPACAQTTQAKPVQPAMAPAAPVQPAPAPAANSTAQAPDRSVAYYHLALANIYEDEALENGNTDASRLAV